MTENSTVIKNDRDIQLDHIKIFLMYSVVLTHFLIEFYKKSWQLNLVMGAVEVYTMPMWCFLFGYFRKDAKKCRGDAVRQFLIPYFVFNFFIYAARHFFFGSEFNLVKYKFLTPQESMWFLMAAFIWALLLEELVKIRHILPLCIVAMLVVGKLSEFTTMLALSRTVAFLPFVLAGYFTSRENIEKVRKLPKWVGLLIVALSAPTAWFLFRVKKVMATFPLYAYPFSGYKLTRSARWYVGAGYRAVFLVWSALAIIALLILAPRKPLRKRPEKATGPDTLSIYLLHLFPVYFLLWSEEFGKITSWQGRLMFFAIASAVIVFVCASTPVSRLLHRFLAMIDRIVFPKPAKKKALS